MALSLQSRSAQGQSSWYTRVRVCQRLLLLLISTASVTAWPVPQADSAGPPDQPVSARLEPGRQIRLGVAAAQPLSLGIAAKGWKEAEILIEAPEPGASYVIVSPTGARILSETFEQAGWRVVSFATPRDGLYQLEVRANPESVAKQRLPIRVELLPFATSTRGQLAKANALYSAAETLRNSLQAGDVRQAIPKYKEAALVWQIVGDRAAYVLALAGESGAWLDLSEYQNAIAALDRGIASLDAGSGFFHSLLLSMKAEVYLAWWDNKSAAAIGAQALRIARSLKDPELEARALTTVGGAEYFTHTPSAAVHLDEASRLATASGSTETDAMVLRYQSWGEEDQGRLSRALALMQQSEDAFRRAGDRRKALQSLPYLADIERLAGDNYAALLANSRLLSPVIASGDVENYATVLGNIGTDYEFLNRDRDAMTYLTKAVRAYESIHHGSGRSIYLGELCQVELRQHLLNDALRDCQRSASLVESIHDPKRLAIITWQLGNVHRAFGRTELAVDQYKRAAAISAQVPDPRFGSQTMIDWGDALQSAGRTNEALPLFEKAFALSRQAEDPIVELEARFRIARWHANAGEDADAIRELKVALDTIEVQRSAVQNEDLRASYLAAVRKCHQLYVDILMREHDAHPESSSDIAALEISESARARTLLDSLSHRGPGRAAHQPANSAAERIELRSAIDQAYAERLKLMLEGGHNRELEQNSATLMQDIDSLQRMDDAERNDASEMAPTGRSMTTGEIINASKSAPATMLEYALGARKSYLWVVRQGAIKSYVIPVKQDELEQLIRKWRSLAAGSPPREGDDAELARLGADLACKLLDPFVDPGMEKLAIVADGDLALLPFASLPTNGCSATPGPPLIMAHEVVMIPSFSTFLAQSTPEPERKFSKEVAVLADPVFDAGDDRVHVAPADPGLSHAGDTKRQGPALPRLTGTAQEAAGIEQAVGPDKVSLFLGYSASVDSILSPAMRDYRILHLATHGVLDASAPGLSGLVLSLVAPDGQPVAGFLKVHDIASLRLESQLVVLSSCDSGAGDSLGGEGVTGLAHAFLQAGARQVVSTLWSVDDETSKQLMVDFYRQIYVNGADPAEALRRSQLKMMKRPRRSAPYYWAGFEITSIVD